MIKKEKVKLENFFSIMYELEFFPYIYIEVAKMCRMRLVSFGIFNELINFTIDF